ncbi:MAG: cell division protein FtsZ [Myxococcales bacterium]|nr:cell division protein FtsZ [Myxococcales bacterium]MDD9970058.1 cell division protein FtsZ [Myxococcales bacterium]
MGISIEFAEDAELQARIKVVGVGGGGGNAINTMIESGLEGVEFIAANTDTQALSENLAPEKIQLGAALTRGLGAGAEPEVGRKSALEDVERIADVLEGADMVFVTAGMGGGTGTGAAPIISQIARDQGALAVGVVTKPFRFEGRRRMGNAISGLNELAEAVDTIITIPNEKLLAVADDDMAMIDAFRRADDVLVQAVRGISDLIVNAGMINVDFADVKTIMSSTGRALMGTGYGRGENRALEAAEVAINSPLLDDIRVEGATGILINFTAGPDIKLREINQAASLVQEAAHEDANIIFGVVTDPNMEDVVKVTVIATGFPSEDEQIHIEVEQPGVVAPTGRGVRSAAQQVLAQRPHAGRVANRSPNRVPNRDAGRDAARPQRQSGVGRPRTFRNPLEPGAPRAQAEPPPEHPQQRPAGTRGRYGTAVVHDEAVLDIPTFLRRSKA